MNSLGGALHPFKAPPTSPASSLGRVFLPKQLGRADLLDQENDSLSLRDTRWSGGGGVARVALHATAENSNKNDRRGGRENTLSYCDYPAQGS